MLVYCRAKLLKTSVQVLLEFCQRFAHIKNTILEHKTESNKWSTLCY